MDLNPLRGRTPEIWIGGQGPRMLRLTGMHGDGWYPVSLFPDGYAAQLATIQRTAKEAGLDPDAIRAANQIFVVAAGTEQEARTMLGTKGVRFSTLMMPASAWQRIGAEHPLGAQFRGYVDFVPESYSRDTLEDALQQIPPDVVATFMAWGTPEQVVDKLTAFAAAGMRHAVLMLLPALISHRAAVYCLRAGGSSALSHRPELRTHQPRGNTGSPVLG